MKFVAPILLVAATSANAVTPQDLLDASNAYLLDLIRSRHEDLLNSRNNANPEPPPVQSDGALAINFNDHISGSWYNPDFNGIGWNIEVHGNLAMTYHYFQDEEGNNGWDLCQGERTFSEHFGGHLLVMPCYVPNGRGANPVRPVGNTLVIGFVDCNNGIVESYTDTGELIFRIPMQRLTPAWGSCQ